MIKFIDDGSPGQMATVRFDKPTTTAFGLAQCCFRPQDVCAQAKASSAINRCNGRDAAYDRRRARAAAKREQNYLNQRQFFQDEKARRAAAKRRRLEEEEASGVDRRRPCERFFAGKCTRVYTKCGRRHGSMDEAARIMCASCEGPNYEEGWVCSYTKNGETCPFLHG